jgi:hypothetical protein
MEFSLIQALDAGGNVATLVIAYLFFRIDKRITILEIKHDMKGDA